MFILGVKIDNLTMDEAVKKAAGFLSGDKQHYIVTPNPEIVIRASRNSEYQSIINGSSISIPDGIGVVWASRVFSKHGLAERVSGVDFMWRFLGYLEARNKLYGSQKVLLAGGKNGVAEASAIILKQRFPGLNLHFLEDVTCEHSLVAIGSEIRPDMIFVALGAPKQEMWIKQNLKKFHTVKIAMGVGGSFDFISGKIKRAPRWMRSAGLEWLWRFLVEPRRFRRILNAVFVFPLKVFAACVRR